MRTKEFWHILAAVIILTAVMSFESLLKQRFSLIAEIFLFSVIVLGLNIVFKKFVAYLLDSDVEHKTWALSRYGWKPHWKLKNPIPIGIILPIFFAIFSLGLLKITSLLTYETQPLKIRAAKRLGFYSFTEMTEWHNALVGAAGIFILLVIAPIAYLLDFSLLSKIAVFYAFWNLIPLSNLDGSQIFFGSRVLWATLAAITLIFTAYTLIL